MRVSRFNHRSNGVGSYVRRHIIAPPKSKYILGKAKIKQTRHGHRYQYFGEEISPKGIKYLMFSCSCGHITKRKKKFDETNV